MLSETALGCARETLGNRFVYVVLSPRARGLSVGVNLNPDRRCNFDCVYCEVNRSEAPRGEMLDVEVLAAELEQTLSMAKSGRLRENPRYKNLPDQLLEVRHVALSGEGEPTLCPNFADVVEAVVHLRASGIQPFFKLVLITNATGFGRPDVVAGLKLFSPRDEVWAKLEAGTPSYFERMNRPDCSLESVLYNILQVARQRPVTIQSLFPLISGEGPSVAEIDAYVARLKDLKEAGAQIPLVQVYSATRPAARPDCTHMPLKIMSEIARRIRTEAGIQAEVF
jgi:wyosine [tRNA(Phe)-imidazoG37] synthetase (radical SAM superfamily)